MHNEPKHQPMPERNESDQSQQTHSLTRSTQRSQFIVMRIFSLSFYAHSSHDATTGRNVRPGLAIGGRVGGWRRRRRRQRWDGRRGARQRRGFECTRVLFVACARGACCTACKGLKGNNVLRVIMYRRCGCCVCVCVFWWLCGLRETFVCVCRVDLRVRSRVVFTQRRAPSRWKS